MFVIAVFPGDLIILRHSIHSDLEELAKGGRPTGDEFLKMENEFS